MKKIFKNILVILSKKEKRQFAVLIILDVLINIADILSLALLLWIIQFYIQPSAQVPNFLPAWLGDKNSVTLIALFVVLFALKNLVAFIISSNQYKFISKVAVRISEQNLSKYQQASFEEFVTIDSSVQIRRIAFQPFDYCQFILSGSQQIITQVSLVILAVTAILIFNAKLFLLLLLILFPPVIIVFYFIKKRLSGVKQNIRLTNERSFQYLLDALKGYVEGNIYGRNNFFLQRFITARKKFSAYLFRSLSIQGLPGRVIEAFAVLGLFVLIAIGKFTGNEEGASLITIGAFMAAAYRIIPGMVKIINISGQMKAYEFPVSDFAPAETINTDNSNVSNIESIEFKDVSFQYKDLPVLNNFNMKISKGDFIGIMGRSGKGKTTILNLLLGFLSPDAGKIMINNPATDSDLRKKYWPFISYVRQQNFFIYDTILRNITLAEENFDKDKLEYALKISGVDELLKQFPEGIGKIITENGKNISGGQQQRIAIARALYKNADIILLDEPFNELDETSEIALLEHFQQLAGKGKLVILVTHDAKARSYCNKIISLDE